MNSVIGEKPFRRATRNKPYKHTGIDGVHICFTVQSNVYWFLLDSSENNILDALSNHEEYLCEVGCYKTVIAF